MQSKDISLVIRLEIVIPSLPSIHLFSSVMVTFHCTSDPKEVRRMVRWSWISHREECEAGDEISSSSLTRDAWLFSKVFILRSTWAIFMLSNVLYAFFFFSSSSSLFCHSTLSLDLPLNLQYICFMYVRYLFFVLEVLLLLLKLFLPTSKIFFDWLQWAVCSLGASSVTLHPRF